MSTLKKRENKKISSTLLRPDDLEVVDKFKSETGATESVAYRALIRLGLREWKRRRISTLELVKLGAY